MQWDESIERLCARYCDESQIRIALHAKQYFFYKRQLKWFQLPIIILSACSGSVQFLSKSFPKHESHIVTGTATLSIIVSIISSVMTYLKLGENTAKNETAEISWQAFYNSISHQLSLKREHRDDPETFIADVKQKYERLFELSPIPDRKFIQQVKKSVAKYSTEEFQVPCYLNGFKATKVWEDSFEENTESLGSEVQLDVPVV